MKIVNDKVSNAEGLLQGTMALLDSVLAMSDATLTLQQYAQKTGVRKSLPMFVAETAATLKKSISHDFKNEYPAIASVAVNGDTGGMLNRLVNAIYSLSNVYKELNACNCVVKADADRKRLHESILDIIADLSVFLCIRFELYTCADGVCTMAVANWCDHQRITPEVFYAMMLDNIKSTGREFYAYEEISETYTEMLREYPEFMADCEDNNYRLTDSIAKDILDKKLTIADATERFVKESGSEVEDDKLTPSSIIANMSLN